MNVTSTVSAVRVRLASALVVGLTLGAAVRADASNVSVTLDPQDGAGRVSFAGGGADLVGAGLGVGVITGLDTPTRGPTSALQVVNGSLDFNTGGFTGRSADGNEWTFGADGGSLTVTGAVPSLGIDTATTLLRGGFTGPSFVQSLPGRDLKVQGGEILSVVNPTLAAYFGLPTGGALYGGGLSILFQAEGASPGAFSSNGFTGGTLALAPVPEPGGFAVFGALAASAAVWLRPRRP